MGVFDIKYLIVAEKPELGNAVKSAIDSAKTGDIPPGDYRVVSAMGHLLELKAPEDYDPKYKQWRIEDLPIAFPHWAEVPKHGRDENHSAAIRSKLSKIKEGLSWCDRVINCGDPDDEGQYLIDQILDYYHNKKPVLRLLVNDNSPANIIKQMNNLQDNALYYKLGRGAYARTVADAMFGYNFTRYYSKTYNTQSGPLSVGRVQTPTLGLVVMRDRQIENHVKQKYYLLSFAASTGGLKEPFRTNFSFRKDFSGLVDGKILNKAEYDPVIAQVDGKTFEGNVKREIVNEDPPLPFNLAKLQAYCATHHKLTPDAVQEITQSLRGKALITYNRSSCQYLHEEQHKDAPALMPIVFKNLGITAPVDYSIKSKCFNDKYTDGEPHHAIIPIATEYDVSTLSPSELAVYKAVCLYYILQFLPPRKREKTTAVILLPDGNKLQGSSSKTIDPGYAGYLKNGNVSDDDISSLSTLAPGNYQFSVYDPKVTEKETTPPKRYTQASLIEDMTSAAKYVTDPNVKKLLIEKDQDKQTEHGGIGTPATRAGIVTTLLKRGYIKEVQEGKSSHIESTPLGRSFFDMLPENIKSFNTTTKWWVITQAIQHEGESEDALFKSVLQEIETFLANPPKKVAIEGLAGNSGREPIGKCPRCGRDVVEGKKGFGCVGYKDKSEPCNFTIWKTHPLLAKSNKTVTAAMAKSLLSKGSCNTGTLKSQAGKSYKGILKLDDQGPGGYVNLRFEFDNTPSRKSGRGSR